VIHYGLFVIQINPSIEDICAGKKYQESQGQNQLRAKVVERYFMDMIHDFRGRFAGLVEAEKKSI
jgi:hypothetical protein